MDDTPERQEDLMLESAVWTAELGAYEWDIASDRVRWLNGWCAYYEIDPCEGEGHGDRWRAMVHPEDRVMARHEFDAHLAGQRERFEAEYRIRTLRGEWRWIRNRAYMLRSGASGRESRMVGACVVVDERKRTEIALGRTQRKLEALASAAPTWMILTNADGVVEFVNRPMHCLAEGTVMGRNIVSLFADPAEAARVEEFRRSLVRGCDARTHTMILEDGRTLATWARPVIENGRVIGIASVTADVSERQDRQRELLAAIHQEQQRFARDLHDGLGQELTGISLLVKSLSSRVAKASPALVAELAEIVSYVTTAIETTRAVARGVSPVGREQGGLEQALQDLARRWGQTHGANVHCRIQATHGREIEPMLAENFFHIAQEALTNAMKHSGASEIVVELRHTPRRLYLTVTDNGNGLAPQSGADSPLGPQRTGGLGLKTMRDRAELMGAQLKIEASTHGGTRVDCVYKWRHAGAEDRALGVRD